MVENNGKVKDTLIEMNNELKCKEKELYELKEKVETKKEELENKRNITEQRISEIMRTKEVRNGLIKIDDYFKKIREKERICRRLTQLPKDIYSSGIFRDMTSKLIKTDICFMKGKNYKNVLTINKNGLNTKHSYLDNSGLEDYSYNSNHLDFQDFFSLLKMKEMRDGIIKATPKNYKTKVETIFNAYDEYFKDNKFWKFEEILEDGAYRKGLFAIEDDEEIYTKNIPFTKENLNVITIENNYPNINNITLKKIEIQVDYSGISLSFIGEKKELETDELLVINNSFELFSTTQAFIEEIYKILDEFLETLTNYENELTLKNEKLKEDLAIYLVGSKI